VRALSLLVILGVAVHILLPQLASLQHSYQIIRQMAIWALILAAAAQVASYLGSGYLLSAIVRLGDGAISVVKGTAITLAAASIGMVAGGMVGSATATYRWIREENAGSKAAGLAGTIPGFFNTSILVLVSIVGLIHLFLVHQLTRLQVVSFALVLLTLASVVGLAVWGVRRRDRLTGLAVAWQGKVARLRRRDATPEKVRERLGGLFEAGDLVLSGGWQGPALGATLNVAFDMLTLYFLFVAAGHPISLGALLTGYGLPLLLAKVAFLVPGGVGVIEGTMAALYVGLGIPDPVTVVVVLGYRLLSFWLPLVAGFPTILFIQRRRRPRH
jgi:uncharacterized protein (TIRG00374 family)